MRVVWAAVGGRAATWGEWAAVGGQAEARVARAVGEEELATTGRCPEAAHSH